MGQQSKHLNHLPPLQRAVVAMKEMRTKIDKLENAQSQSIAIVNMGCRFPGNANTPETFWRNLKTGLDCVTPIPENRWPIQNYYDPNKSQPGKMYIREGGFLSDIDQFDPHFFNISPKEAECIDPQQRLFLEICYETLEKSGYATQHDNTGVFVGITTNDYAQKLNQNPDYLNAYFVTGNPLNAVAGRISYALGLSGPSMAIDTACSSSLVAVHLACQSLRSGDCNMALAGGVNIILSPHVAISLSQAKMLAKNGRCKTFSADADGYGRGEGCGVILLKRLDDAMTDNDTILAVIKGSAVNQDGASSGFTVPNGLAQQKLIKRALSNAHVSAEQISYIEAHGTGTSLGDPIEINALAQVFGPHKQKDTPLLVGAVKTNIGHLESAAGIAGIIKTVLSLQHKTIPSHLHCQQTNPQIDWATIPISVNTQTVNWPHQEKPLVAGVSSFGASGTNAHIILAQAPEKEKIKPNETDHSHHILTLSAKSKAALPEQVLQITHFLEKNPNINLADICYSANTPKPHFKHRRAFLAKNHQQLIQQLQNNNHPPTTSHHQTKIVFLFTGQGSQYPDMGKALYYQHPIFKHWIDQCQQFLEKDIDIPLTTLLFDSDETTLAQTQYTQPVLFAFEYALAQLWLSWGIKPDYILGHSVGEYVAACVSGVFNLEQGLKLIANRGRIIQQLPLNGGMLSLQCDPDAAQTIIAPHPSLSIAAINGPFSVVIAGNLTEIDTVISLCKQENIKSRRLAVSHAFHSALLAPTLPEMKQILNNIKFTAPKWPILSNVTGTICDNITSVDYWLEHQQACVQFHQSMTYFQQYNACTFIEMGPKPTLCGMGKQSLPSETHQWLPSLRPNTDPWQQILTSLKTLYQSGIDINWKQFDAPYHRQHISLPTYPFQRKSYWAKTIDSPMIHATPKDTTSTGHIQPINPNTSAATNIRTLMQQQLDLLSQSNQILSQTLSKQLNLLASSKPSTITIDAHQRNITPTETTIKTRQFDLSPGQKELWFLTQTSPDANLAYHEMFMLTFDGKPDHAIFNAALQQIIQRHSILQIHHLDGEKQAINPESKTTLTTIDLTQSDLTLIDWIQQTTNTPLLMTQNTFLNAHWIKTASNQYHFFLITHHIIADGWTLGLLVQELAAIYNSLLTNKSAQLPAPQDFTDFLQWQKSLTITPQEQQYWQNQLAQSTAVLELPYINSRANQPSYQGARLHYIIPTKLTSQLKQFSQASKTTLFNTLLCTFELMLHRLSGLSAFFISIPVAGQAISGLHNLMGQCSSLLPLRVTIDSDVSFSKQLATTQKAFLNAQTHQKALFADPALLNQIPFQTVIFNLDRAVTPTFNDLKTKLHSLAVHAVKTDLFLNIIDINHELYLDFDYDNHLFNEATVRAWANTFLDLLQVIPTQNENRLIDILTNISGTLHHPNDGYVNGFKVIYGDVINALKQLPNIKDVAILQENNKHPFDTIMTAYLTSHDDQNINIVQIRQSLKLLLPDYKIPTYFAQLDSIPLTTEGKTDFNALLNRNINKQRGQNTFKPASTEMEYTLLSIWTEILKQDTIGIEDNFFELGGHSLQATQIVSRINIKTGLNLSLSQFFNHPTIVDQADIIEQSAEISKGALITKAPENESKPLSFAQQRLWFLYQLEGPNPAYNLTEAIQLNGCLNQDALLFAYNEIRKRHNILRAVFKQEDEFTYQIINPYQATTLDCINLSPDANIQNIIDQESSYCFKLENDNLFRIQLFRMTAQQHLLLVNIHHIISDGWSEGILITELSTLYHAHLNNQSNPLPPLAIQYTDFAYWQQHDLTVTLSNQQTYWHQQLSQYPTILDLTTDKPRPSVQTFNGADHRFTIGGILNKKLVRLSQQSNVTLFMTLLSAWSILLYRYSGQQEMLIGTPIANRHYQEIEDLMGLFVNTLVINADFSANPTFFDFLQTIRTTTLNAYKHQDLPFEKLVETLQPERSLSHSPLFQVMFILQNTPASNLKLDHLATTSIKPSTPCAKYDLTLNLEQKDNHIQAELEYNIDLFDAVSIEHLAHHYVNLLHAITQHPFQTVDALPLLTAQEKNQIIEQWNHSEVTFPDTHTIHQLFEQQVNTNPDKTALIDPETTLSFDQLNKKANQVAHFLLSKAMQHPSLIAICVERSIDMVISLLAILKTGSAYLPLDPAYPVERLSFMLQDADAKVLITQSDLENRLPDYQGQSIYIDQFNDDQTHWPATDIHQDSQPDDMAYLIYTSGSTGKPKGVMGHHQGMINRFQWMWQRYPFLADEVGCQKTALSFLDSVWEIFGFLLKGIPITIITDNEIKDPTLLIQSLERHQISRIVLVPSLLRAILDYDTDITTRLKHLRYCTTSGEALTPELFNRFKSALPHCVLINLYGSSEVSADCTWFDSNQNKPEHVIPIGRPIANNRIYILDNLLNPVPTGTAGEIYISGIGIAAGYLGQPELTAERFIPDPFIIKPSMMFKSGDRARYLSDGQIEHLGRLDNQVKIRGFRIELGEIEAQLSTLSSIAQCMTIVREDHPGQKYIVAYLISSQNPSQQTLKAYLKDKLPDYMIPSVFVTLEQFPLTPSGKINRLALPKPDFSTLSEKIYRPPSTPEQQIMANIWSDVLHIDHIGLNDHFFELGGHSLMATQVISRIKKAFKTDLAVKLLFEHPVLINFTQICHQTTTNLNNETISVSERNQPAKLTHAQQRLWFLEQLEGANGTYNISHALQLTGPLDIHILNQTFDAIVSRHEILQCVFTSHHGIPEMVKSSSLQPTIAYTDLSQHDHIEQALTTLLNVAINQPFDLTCEPLIRLHLYQKATQDYVLLVNMHHIISDGWSLGILVEEFCHIYPTLTQNKAIQLPDLPVQYTDYAHWQNNRLDHDKLNQQTQFWQQHLKETPDLINLPLDFKRPNKQTYQGKTITFRIEPALTQQLKTLANEHDATLFMVLLAAWNILLCRYTNQHHIVIGTPVANRNHADIEPLIGLFTNTLAIHTNLSNDPTFTELLASIKENTLNAYQHQDMPFEQLVEALNVPQNLSHNPIFQVMMVLQNTPSKAFDLPDIAVQPYPLENQTSKFDMLLAFEQDEDQLTAFWEYNTALFAPQTLHRMVDHFKCLLSSIPDLLQQSIFQLPLMPAEALQQILFDWNQTIVDYGTMGYTHELISQQAQRTPNWTALMFDGKAMSYAELDQKTNQLAQFLILQQTHNNPFIGVYMERSFEMVIALVGIMKAGGAYVPIDPSHPADRIAYVIKDAGIDMILTQSRFMTQISDHEPLKTVDLEQQWDRIHPFPITPVNVNIEPHQVVYVIYTSGSTGKPKGVLISHHSLQNRLLWMQQHFNAQPEDRFLQKTPYSFDVSVWEFFWPLISGVTLVLCKPGGHRDSLHLIRFINEMQITMLHFVPPMLNVFLDQPEVTTCSTIRRIFCSGEVMSNEIKNKCLNRLETELHNMYGPTETTIEVSHQPCQKQDAPYAQSVPIGKPINNTQLYVLDAQRNPVPIGVVGELYIGGANVALGYHNKPELTQENFIPNPFSHHPNDIIYKSGDLVRYLPDGNIEYLSRVDFQVKLRGFRIELGEIENTLMLHPDINKAIVLLREDTPGDKRLVAYYVTTQAITDLKTFASHSLPEYMLPSVYVQLTELPITANGKTDRKALPQPEVSSSFDHYIAPRTETETIIADICADILKLEQMGIHDNFFDAGGHSLLVTQVISRVNQSFNVEITIREFFENTNTVEKLANWIEQKQLAQMDDADLSAILEEVDGLSADEISLLLEE